MVRKIRAIAMQIARTQIDAFELKRLPRTSMLGSGLPSRTGLGVCRRSDFGVTSLGRVGEDM
jgi:hypothetical protein